MVGGFGSRGSGLKLVKVGTNYCKSLESDTEISSATPCIVPQENNGSDEFTSVSRENPSQWRYPELELVDIHEETRHTTGKSLRMQKSAFHNLIGG